MDYLYTVKVLLYFYNLKLNFKPYVKLYFGHG